MPRWFNALQPHTMLGCSGIATILAGSFALDEGCPSDYRTLWIDVPFEDITKVEKIDQVKNPPRRLEVNDPRLAEEYAPEVHFEVERSDTLTKIEQEAVLNVLTNDLMKTYDEIGASILEIRNVRKVQMGGIHGRHGYGRQEIELRYGPFC